MTAVNIPAVCRQALAAPANGEAAFIGLVFKPHEASPNRFALEKSRGENPA
jgi:hypothetical protein